MESLMLLLDLLAMVVLVYWSVGLERRARRRREAASRTGTAVDRRAF
jgi:hypothetical protein